MSQPTARPPTFATQVPPSPQVNSSPSKRLAAYLTFLPCPAFETSHFPSPYRSSQKRFTYGSNAGTLPIFHAAIFERISERRPARLTSQAKSATSALSRESFHTPSAARSSPSFANRSIKSASESSPNRRTLIAKSAASPSPFPKIFKCSTLS